MPHIMLEWYPHVLPIPTPHFISPTRTMNVVEFDSPEELTAFEPKFIAAQEATDMETAIEDDEIGERMDDGDNEIAPYPSLMEGGMQHFHEWYRQIMGAHIPQQSAFFATLSRATSALYISTCGTFDI